MNKSKFLDIRRDTCFKRVFGTERNKDILIDMLNDVVSLEGNAQITDVSFLQTAQDPELAYKKQSIVDILCQDQFNNKIIIELQVAERAGFEKRAQYYAAKAYSSQLSEGEAYHDLKQVIFVAFTNYIVFKDKQHFKSDHIILDKSTFEHDLKDFSFTFIELSKFNKTEDQLTSFLDGWSYFFKHSHQTREQDLPKIVGARPSIGRAYEEINRFNWSDAEYRAYERELKNAMDFQAIEDARVQRLKEAEEKGLEKGLEKGRQEGREEGEQKGIEKGREQERLDIARQLFATGMNINQIQSITKLTISKLEQIQHLNTLTNEERS